MDRQFNNNNILFLSNKCQSLELRNIYASYVFGVYVVGVSWESVKKRNIWPYSQFKQFNLNNRIRIINPFITYHPKKYTQT